MPSLRVCRLDCRRRVPVEVVRRHDVPDTNVWFLRHQLDPTRRLVAIGSTAGQVRLWRLDSPAERPLLNLRLPCRRRASAPSTVRCSAISRGMRFLVCCCDDGSFSLLELAGHLPARAINGGVEGSPAPSSVAKLGQALLDLERVAAAAAAAD